MAACFAFPINPVSAVDAATSAREERRRRLPVELCPSPGIAEQYEPGPLVGRKVVIVANLQPATLMGVESNGMVLAASHEGTVSLLTLDKDVPPGSKVK